MRTLKKNAVLMGILAASLVAAPFFVAEAKVPNDALYGEQWYLPAIGAPAAWDRTTGSPDVIVAVVDTAIDIDHEDLKPNIWQNTDEVFGNAKDDDGNGFIDDVYGWNFERDSWEVRPHVETGDEIGYVHGTLVSSLIAAKGDNGVGIAGVAWGVRIMPVVALDARGSGNVTDVANAIRYAVDNGADIINLSLEGYSDIPVVEEALAYAQSHGVLTVAAAGNGPFKGGLDLDDIEVFPACLSNQPQFGVFGVGSVDQTKRKAAYANYGSCILASAPGEDIFGARPTAVHVGGEQTTFPGYEGGFGGTSLATPLVSGSAALLKSLRPDWGWAELREWLLSSAEPIDHLQDPAYRTRIGRGLLNIGAAVAQMPVLDTQVTAPAPALSPEPVSSTDPRAEAAAEAVAIELGAGAVLVRVTVGSELVLAEETGGRAWGITSDGTVTLFRPYGDTYQAGLDAVAVPGGVAFAPRSGGGHLMVTDLAGRRLVSVFPFGKTARGRWDVTVLPAGQGEGAELVMSGPLGSRALLLDRLGAEGWRDITLSELERRLAP